MLGKNKNPQLQFKLIKTPQKHQKLNITIYIVILMYGIWIDDVHSKKAYGK